MDNGEENKKGFISTLISDGISIAWKKLPLPFKIKIIGVLAVVLLVFIFFLIIVSNVPFNFLDYNKSASKSNDISEVFSEYWYDYCKNSNCSDADKEEADRIQKSQKEFFDKLNKLAKKYDLDDEQKYIILTTIFFNYDIDKFSEGSGYEFDGTEDDEEKLNTDTELNISSMGDVYIEEKSTLKELMKQFSIYSAKCENGNDSYELKKSSDEPFKFTFLEYWQYKIGFSKPTVDGFDEAANACLGEIKYTRVNSNESFYEYLENSKFFDSRSNFSTYFVNYADANRLDYKEIDTWSEDDLINVRKRIVNEIKEIVKEYIDTTPNAVLASMTNNSSFWWPIGSATTTESNGITYASDEPQVIKINSLFGYRQHPVYGYGHGHSGIDISGLGVLGVINVIASRSGVVVEVETGCKSFGDKSCGRTYGNHIIIKHADGTHTVYGHLHENTITVSLNESVNQGQVIGKVGSSGTSTGSHLHFEVRMDASFQSRVDPLDYVDPENPRPKSSVSEDFMAMLETMEGGPVSSNGEYLVICNKDDVPTVGHGVTLTYQYPRFEKYGVILDNSNEYYNYCGKTMPVDLIDAIYNEIVEDEMNKVKAQLAKESVVVSQYQLEALTSLNYNCGIGLGSGETGFFANYKKYGATESLCTNWWIDYCKAKGVNVAGVKKRRKNECNLFVNGIYNGSYD